MGGAAAGIGQGKFGIVLERLGEYFYASFKIASQISGNPFVKLFYSQIVIRHGPNSIGCFETTSNQ
jgi:hypothetical protein